MRHVLGCLLWLRFAAPPGQQVVRATRLARAVLICAMSNDALIAKYEALLKSRPDDELLRFSLGKALLDAGRVDDAERELRAALAAKDDWMIVTMLLARIADLNKDMVTAKALWEKGLELAIAQNHEGPMEECRAELQRLERIRQNQQGSGGADIPVYIA